jgi:NADH-quinone oxidoreductase subunit C
MPELTSRLGLALPQGESGRAAALTIAPGDLRLVAERLLCQDWFLEDVCGLDVAEGLAVLYHFAHWTQPGRVVLRVMIPRDNPVCPSIEGIYPGAGWHERETRDFFGIDFTGAANTMPLLLDESIERPPLLKPEESRISTNQLWPHGEWVGPAKGHVLAEELMSICGPGEPGGQTGGETP